MPTVQILLEPEIRTLITPSEARQAVRDGFVKLVKGDVVLPGVINLDIPEHAGEVHVKSAYIRGAPYFSIKEAAGFYRNSEKGLPVGSGMITVFHAATGLLAAILFDNGHLTELRTAAAGALAAELLARAAIERVAIVGAGVQARYQLEALLDVRKPASVRICGRSPDRVRACAAEMAERFGLDVRAMPTIREAVEGADLVITVTPAREPLVQPEWIKPGTHVTAVGSDGPEKQELAVGVLAKANKVVADRLEQCLRLGEIHHAVAAGVLTPAAVHAELGEVAAGMKPGRTSDREITVADLTGVGVQDAAVANHVIAAAARRGLGRMIEI
jgi:ectoine utilization protein EutC